jgi:nucleoside-diphosphate-sugar epimerase
MSTVLVTGGSGFVGSHTILQLLAAGHTVRTTVRNLSKEPELRALFEQHGAGLSSGRLSFFAANLESDANWPQAVEGCDYVLHVASPFPAQQPKDENELIFPAREGTLRVLRAARDARVKRVVITSSFVAIGYGHPPRQTPFDETDWTNLDSPRLTPYAKSKTIAERAAWDFVAREGRQLELAVVNPVGIFGPALSADMAASVLIIQRFLEGAVPICPKLSFGAVDVRDVADLHLRAMSHPAAAGERFLAVAGEFVYAIEAANILKEHLGDYAKRVPTRELPDWLVRIAANFVPDLRPILPELGIPKQASNAKAKRLLNWQPRSNEEAILATGESLVRLGLIKTGK